METTTDTNTTASALQDAYNALMDADFLVKDGAARDAISVAKATVSLAISLQRASERV